MQSQKTSIGMVLAMLGRLQPSQTYSIVYNYLLNFCPEHFIRLLKQKKKITSWKKYLDDSREN